MVNEPSAVVGREETAELVYWQGRLFKNTYTRGGKRYELAGWSVKIQHQGKRHTFSLGAGARRAAALEAKAIYEQLQAEGGEATLRAHGRRNGKEHGGPGKQEAGYWQERLLVRRYRFGAAGGSERDLAVKIDHEGSGYFFPLYTAEAEAGAQRAQVIYQQVAEQGWELACREHARELVVGLEWSANPVMWTYTTIHTLVHEMKAAEVGAGRLRVVVLEPEAGIRRALLWAVNQGGEFTGVGCESVESFNRVVNSGTTQLVLLNRALAEAVGYQSPGQLGRLENGVAVLTYSVSADGDQLFTSTPGGAQAYLLKRTKPERLLEPMEGKAGAKVASVEEWPGAGKGYFRELLHQSAPRPEASGLGKLTRREHEVLVLMSKGRVDKEIAQALGISAWTVHAHIKNIFERLQVRTRTEAVVRYLEK